MILEGNCLDEMKKLDDNSVDSIVTDPPYGLSFMGKKWDYDVPSVAIWREALRVLKPGGHLLSFAGSRTYHRMTVNIEDAGFEIRDQIMWIYGSGFPKSHNISKGIDKKLGAEREMIRKKFSPQQMMMKDGQNERPWQNKAKELGYHETASDEPASPEAKQWNGWGTALKPAHEPIVVARKPIIGTVAENILEHGTGGINIDESRVKHDEPDIERKKMDSPLGMFTNPNREGERGAGPAPEGRFPANVIHDGSDEVLEGFPDTKSGDGKPHHVTRESQSGSMSGKNYAGRTLNTFGDEGSAARFFYCAKASTGERNEGLESLEPQEMGNHQSSLEGGKMLTGSGNERSNTKNNFHPTVKPIALMEYLCRMVTPKGGTVLDPFMGSGTTGIAATRLGFEFIGIEMTPEYIELAATRIAYWSDNELTFEDGDVVLKPKPKAEWL
tara:strand:+ start:745 stop:2070 length:1326 start_codon:yes stop_codon:yes gene_type:complete